MGSVGSGGPIVPGVAKIAVLRANALGDFLFAIPALEALRATYPQAEIVLLARDWHAEFVPGRVPAVDRVVVVPNAEGIWAPPGEAASETELDRFFSEMTDERFDLALQLHGGGRNSNPFVRRLGARVTVGLRTPDAEALDRSVAYVYYHSEIFRLLEAVATVGATPGPLEPRLTVLDEDRAEAAEHIGEDIGEDIGDHIGDNIAGRGPFVALHPGATDGRRRWPVEPFAAVGDALAKAGGHVLVTGESEEADIVDEVVAGMTEPVTGLAGAVSTGGLAGVLSRCAVVVSNDTGPLHMAAAVGAATVGIFWCGNLINAGPVTRQRHRPSISWRLDCPVCGTNCITGECDHDDSFVADVTVDEVRESALDLLASFGDTQSGRDLAHAHAGEG